jgi:hypothetical protein
MLLEAEGMLRSDADRTARGHTVQGFESFALTASPLEKEMAT